MPNMPGREFGNLEANVANLTTAVQEVDRKLNDVMTRTDIQNVIESITAIQKAHEQRILELEDYNKLKSSSVWSRIGLAADANFVSFIGKAVFIIFGGLIAAYFLNTYSIAPKAVVDDINVEKRIK